MKLKEVIRENDELFFVFEFLVRGWRVCVMGGGLQGLCKGEKEGKEGLPAEGVGRIVETGVAGVESVGVRTSICASRFCKTKPETN